MFLIYYLSFSKNPLRPKLSVIRLFYDEVLSICRLSSRYFKKNLIFTTWGITYTYQSIFFAKRSRTQDLSIKNLRRKVHYNKAHSTVWHSITLLTLKKANCLYTPNRVGKTHQTVLCNEHIRIFVYAYAKDTILTIIFVFVI